MMGKCAWCGTYIPDSADKQILKGFGAATGLDLFAKPLGALIPQYCSKQCKLAAQEAKGGSGNTGGGSGNIGGGSGTAEAEAEKARIEVREREDAAFEAKVKEGHNAVAAVMFGEDASSITNGLLTLLALVNQYDPKTKSNFVDQNALKGVRQSAFEKIEMGIMLLRSKDAAQADYFQSKFEEKKGTLTGKINAAKDMGKKLGGLFGKK
jgi:hypothetical protein